MKQLLMPLAQPLGAIWFLMLASLGWLLWRRQWRSALWMGWPVLLIFLLGSTPLAEGLIASVERPYALTGTNTGALPHQYTGLPTCDAVVVLGGGYYPSEYDAYGFALEGAASRLVTGLELFKSGRAKHLVLGGSWPTGGESELVLSDRVLQWMESLPARSEAVQLRTNTGLTDSPTNRPPSPDILTLGICYDTHDEAIAFRKLCDTNHWQRVLLVTSALHMPRSVDVFKKQGLEVVTVACDFQVCGAPAYAINPFPRQRRFELLRLYLHEKIGWLVYRMRGWV